MRTAKGEKRFSSSQMLTYGPHAGGSPRRVSAGTKSPEEAPLFNSKMWWSGIYCIFRIKITLQRWGGWKKCLEKNGCQLATRYTHRRSLATSARRGRNGQCVNCAEGRRAHVSNESRCIKTPLVVSPCQLFFLQLPHFLPFFVSF